MEEDDNNMKLSMADLNCISFRENFDRKLIDYDKRHQGSHRKAWTAQRIIEVMGDIRRARVTNLKHKRTSMDYYWMNKYDILTNSNEDCLIFKRQTTTAPSIQILPREQYYDVLSNIHKSIGHGGRDKILNEIKYKYYIPKKAVEIFVSLCPVCEVKRSGPKRTIVPKPVPAKDFNLSGQLHLIDFQSCPDGEFEWLLNYQDDATKFVNLRPLRTSRVSEVALELIKIFLVFGAPCVLQSADGSDFTANVIKELVSLWPDCNVVVGNSATVDSQDVENMVQAWMDKTKSTNWSVGCYFVQNMKNSLYLPIIAASPYKALFGREPKAVSKGPNNESLQIVNIKTEDEIHLIKSEPVEAMNSDQSGD